MTEYSNTNRGAIWKNEKKETDKHPDFTGSLNVDGKEFWVSAWRRRDDAGPKAPALSFAVKPKEQQRGPSPRSGTPMQPKGSYRELDDEVPFAPEWR